MGESVWLGASKGWNTSIRCLVMDVCIVLYVHFTHCSTVHTCVHMYIQMVVEVCVATICDSSQSTSKVSFEHDVL